jgi:hypothetical protein
MELRVSKKYNCFDRLSIYNVLKGYFAPQSYLETKLFCVGHRY